LRRHVPPDDARLLSALMRQGALLSESGDPAAAEQVLADVLAHRSRLLGRDSALLGKVRNALGVAYFYQGRARDAVPQLEEALAIGERTLDAEDPELAAHRYNLAAALEEEGAYADVERLLRQVLALMEARPGEREWEIGLARQTLGRVLMLAGRAQEARELLEAELPAGDGAPFALNRARQRMHLAEWHRRHGDPAESARLLDLVEADVADIGGRDSIRFAFVQRTRGLLALAAGDGEAARATLEATLALMRKHRGPHFIGIGEVELDLAEVELSARAPRRAARHARAARAVFEATLVDAAPQWQRLARVEAALRGAG
jgi:tetratricopeptide (TPR) repeat protein